MHRCKQEDFGKDDLAKKLFASWKGYMIMCPQVENKDGKKLKLDGAKGMMKTSSFTLRVERCSGEDFCESDTEIDKYISDISI